MNEGGDAEDPGEQRDGADDSESGEKPQGDAQPRAVEQHGGFAPGGERGGIDTGVGIVGENGEALACWRARMVVGSAGARSQRARVSSPMWVRAVESNSKREPLPKRSRSWA